LWLFQSILALFSETVIFIRKWPFTSRHLNNYSILLKQLSHLFGTVITQTFNTFLNHLLTKFHFHSQVISPFVPRKSSLGTTWKLNMSLKSHMVPRAFLCSRKTLWKINKSNCVFTRILSYQHPQGVFFLFLVNTHTFSLYSYFDTVSYFFHLSNDCITFHSKSKFLTNVSHLIINLQILFC
jgi:hypothetical protein